MRIKVRNLTKRYGKTVARDGVSLQIGHGMYGLLGPNRAGKTTLMRIMATTLQPTEGTVLYDDYDVTQHQHEIRKIIGHLPQEEYEAFRARYSVLMDTCARYRRSIETRVINQKACDPRDEWLDATHLERWPPAGSTEQEPQERCRSSRTSIH